MVPDDSPILSQTNCPTKGKSRHSGICKNTCMRQYMTPVMLPPVTWWQNGDTATATVNWTLPHWGDGKGLHIPLASQASLYAEAVPGQQYLDLVSNFVSSQYVSPTGKDKDKTGLPPKTSKPTLSVNPTDCIPDQTRHTPVPYRDPRFGNEIGTMTPSNPDCDMVDPRGYDAAELLWLSQNKKHRRRKHKHNSKKNLECWDYESCYDHCREVKEHDRVLRRVLLAVIGGVAGLAILGMITKAVLKKTKHKKNEKKAAAAQAKKKWGKEAQPAAESSGQHVDGAVDGTTDGTADGTTDSADAAAAADEERARRAAAMFLHTFNGAVMHRRDAIASGSETIPEEQGSVTRRAS